MYTLEIYIMQTFKTFCQRLNNMNNALLQGALDIKYLQTREAKGKAWIDTFMAKHHRTGWLIRPSCKRKPIYSSGNGAIWAALGFLTAQYAWLAIEYGDCVFTCYYHVIARSSFQCVAH